MSIVFTNWLQVFNFCFFLSKKVSYQLLHITRYTFLTTLSSLQKMCLPWFSLTQNLLPFLLEWTFSPHLPQTNAAFTRGMASRREKVQLTASIFSTTSTSPPPGQKKLQRQKRSWYYSYFWRNLILHLSYKSRPGIPITLVEWAAHEIRTQKEEAF